MTGILRTTSARRRCWWRRQRAVERFRVCGARRSATVGWRGANPKTPVNRRAPDLSTTKVPLTQQPCSAEPPYSSHTRNIFFLTALPGSNAHDIGSSWESLVDCIAAIWWIDTRPLQMSGPVVRNEPPAKQAVIIVPVAMMNIVPDQKNTFPNRAATVSHLCSPKLFVSPHSANLGQ